MKKRVKHSLLIAAGIILLVIAVDFIFYRNLYRAYKIQQTSISYSTVTAEDTKPLPIPEEAIKKGRVLKLPILMYHHIGQNPDPKDRLRGDLTVSPEEFEQQVKWLKDNGYQTVRLEDILLYSQGLTKITWPKKPIALTFDDGYLDVFDNAVPIMKKYGFVGSFGIITQWTGISFGTNQYATWDVIAQAKDQGMEIVCHTQNHFDGSNRKFTADYIYNNLSNCQKDIKDHLGSVKPIMIYPYGHYTSLYMEQAKKAGILMSLTVHYGSTTNLDDLLEIPRIRIHPALDLETFKRMVKE